VAAGTIGIDIGGTFTDVACLRADGRLFHAKAPTTPDVVSGVVDGIGLATAKAGIDPATLEIGYIHGTTVATNAVLEGTGAVTGVLTTAGHEDALEIGRQTRSELYDLFLDPETPAQLVPRRLRIGIRERIDGQGRVVAPLDEAQVAAAAQRLVHRHGVESIAVCFLNSYLNGAHEERAAQVIRRQFPQLSVSCSARVNPVFREYDRALATFFDAYVRPVVERYLARLDARLRRGAAATGMARGAAPALHVMQSRGGVTSAAIAAERPVTMFLSGPAAGVIGARFAAELSGRKDVITLDAGGTSTDVSLVTGGAVAHTAEGTIVRWPLRIPMVDITTIGAGGGSVAWLDDGGGLHVGPRSAGSVPGPACYGRGGTEPTATDAGVVLGYLNPDYFADGTFAIDPGRSHAVVGGFADRLGMRAADLALGMHRILASQIAEAIKLVTVKRGVDPRRFSLLAFGGAGAIHAAAVARELELREVLVPRFPGTLCAFGLLVSDFEHDGVRALSGDARAADVEALERHYRALEARGAAALGREGIPGRPIRHRRSADLRYRGQAYEISVPVESPVSTEALARLVAAFHVRHDGLYGHSDASRVVEFVNLRAVTFQVMPRPPEASVIGALPPRGAPYGPSGTRRAVFPAVGEVDTPVYRRAALPAGADVRGPAIVEQEDSTIVVLPGQRGAVDEVANFFIEEA
jgi:N-methylhydantoinase A